MHVRQEKGQLLCAIDGAEFRPRTQTTQPTIIWLEDRLWIQAPFYHGTAAQEKLQANSPRLVRLTLILTVKSYHRTTRPIHQNV